MFYKGVHIQIPLLSHVTENVTLSSVFWHVMPAARLKENNISEIPFASFFRA
jgi:hypothetical protein